jgi:hypothetical protein
MAALYLTRPAGSYTTPWDTIDLCHIGSENEMKRIFQRLMRNQQIERIPGLLGPLSAYRLTTSAVQTSSDPTLLPP